MAEKKLYGALGDWDEVLYEDLSSESTMLVNTTGDDQGLIGAIKASSFKGDKGNKGDPGNVLLPDGLVISSVGYTFVAQESQQEQRQTINTLGLTDDPNSIFLTKTNIGITSTDVVGGNDRRLMPINAIIMWGGLINNIPLGWYLCNGTNGTVDLRDRFVIGTGTTYTSGSIGGSKDAIVVSHNHTASSSSSAGSTASSDAQKWFGHRGVQTGASTTNPEGTDLYVGFTSASVSVSTSVSTTTTNTATGVSGTNANLPPYYALAFIQFKGYV